MHTREFNENDVMTVIHGFLRQPSVSAMFVIKTDGDLINIESNIGKTGLRGCFSGGN